MKLTCGLSLSKSQNPPSTSAPATPTTGNLITSVPFEFWFRADFANVSGGVVDKGLEQKVGATRDISNTGTNRPAFTASDAGIGGRSSWTFVKASSQTLKATSGYGWQPNNTDLGGGNIPGYYYRFIVKQTAWSSGAALFGCGLNTVFGLTATPSVRMNATTSVNSNSNLVINTWRRIEVYFQGSIPNDFLKIGVANSQAGAATAGNGTTSALFGLGGVAAGTSPGDWVIAEASCTRGKPTQAERDACDANDVLWYSNAGLLT